MEACWTRYRVTALLDLAELDIGTSVTAPPSPHHARRHLCEIDGDVVVGDNQPTFGRLALRREIPIVITGSPIDENRTGYLSLGVRLHRQIHAVAHAGRRPLSLPLTNERSGVETLLLCHRGLDGFLRSVLRHLRLGKGHVRVERGHGAHEREDAHKHEDENCREIRLHGCLLG